MKPISFPISLAQLRAELEPSHPPQAGEDSILIQNICTDTRQMRPHSLFIPLRGERFDAHDFLDIAAAGGAVAALVDRIPAQIPNGLRLLPVPDTKIAMGRLANFFRRKLRGKVIAVAGSNGKTSTKHLIHAALHPPLTGSISPKSFNNDVGVPLAIFPSDPAADYLVLELGTNHPGEIRALTQIAEPDIVVITNCSAEHLEGLGDISGVVRENASIIQSLSPNGLLIVNGDDPELLKAVRSFGGKRITFGFGSHNDLHASAIQCDSNGTRFVVDGFSPRAFVPLLGRHSAINALAAIAVARHLWLQDDQILKNLRSATGPEMRLVLQDCDGVRVLNDAYNANPASMKAAIETLAGLPADGRRVAIVGDMRELGETSESLHEEMGRFIARDFPPDLLVCVGVLGRSIAKEAKRHGLGEHSVKYFPDAAAACAMTQHLRQGDLVLLKASRAVRLETIANAIRSRHAGVQAAAGNLPS
jgi:UDP-N-acetylmuramoyl-tripeptide--D-alanyl-D-alanine ligase